MSLTKSEPICFETSQFHVIDDVRPKSLRLRRKPSTSVTVSAAMSCRDIPRPARDALSKLLTSYNYATDLKQDVCEFAVDIETLHRAGVGNHDLRWLVGRGWVRCVQESTSVPKNCRSFSQQRTFTGGERSCFVLSETGVSIARGVRAEETPTRLPKTPELPARTIAPSIDVASNDRERAARTPRWNAVRRQLLFGDELVKEFRLPSPNQITILTAFEEEAWADRIDDPLPQSLHVDAKERLRYTVKSLNRHQKVRAIRFHGDGTGQGLSWEATLRR